MYIHGAILTAYICMQIRITVFIRIQFSKLSLFNTLPSLFTSEHPLSPLRSLQADTLYSEAVGLGLFPSQWQRPVVYERGLRAAPFWSTAELQAYKTELTRVMSQLEEIKK